MLQAKAISETPSGGQIICCSGTFSALREVLEGVLAKAVPSQPDQMLLGQLLR